MSSMSRKEAIKKMKCEEKECEYLDLKGYYSFCKAIFTDNMCIRKNKK